MPLHALSFLFPAPYKRALIGQKRASSSQRRCGFFGLLGLFLPAHAPACSTSHVGARTTANCSPTARPQARRGKAADQRVHASSTTSFTKMYRGHQRTIRAPPAKTPFTLARGVFPYISIISHATPAWNNFRTRGPPRIGARRPLCAPDTKERPTPRFFGFFFPLSRFWGLKFRLSGT